MKPLEQMMATFPSKYARYLPKEWQPLMLDIKSPIFDLYRADPVVDPCGKRYEEQYIVKLPFFDEQRLFKALPSSDLTLSEEEKKRNRHNDDRLFIHLTNPYYEEIKNIYKNNKNQITLSGNMSGQILPDDANDIENDQVFSFKYQRLSRGRY
jgi:5'-3' exonuclease